MRLSHVFHLGIKECRSLVRDPILLVLIVFAFTFSIYVAATKMPETLNKAPIAVVDEDRSALSARIVDAFRKPLFMPPAPITLAQMDARMDAGLDTFALVIPTGFQRDVVAGRQPAVQLNVDATRVSQAFAGSGMSSDHPAGSRRVRAGPSKPPVHAVDLAVRLRFNPQGNMAWFGSVMDLVNQVTMLSIVLTGAALIREREHGTIEHLLVMPVTPFEIMASKVWAMGAVVLVASGLSLVLVVQGMLAVPIEGSVALFMAGAALHLLATTSLGIFLATLARSMPQFGLLLLLILLPLKILSGGMAPQHALCRAMDHAGGADTHFVMISTVLYRGAGLSSSGRSSPRWP
jgi:ABC-2 type transport system permease protein